MSGHNKWSSIKHKKAAADAKRGKAFSRLSKELTIAAKNGGGDPETNPRLRTAIASAKAANMPNDNVDRAIKKGTGELGGVVMEELCYEAYAPGGVAVVVDCLSDNRNRTAAEIRNIFSKNNGNLATTGAVSRIFPRKGRFVIEGKHADEDALMELCFESDVDVEEINMEDENAEIITAPESFDKMIGALEGAGIVPTESGLSRVPEIMVPVGDTSVARQVLRLLDLLEEYDDTQSVTANADIAEDILEALSEE